MDPLGPRQGSNPWQLIAMRWHASERLPIYLFLSIILVLTSTLVTVDVFYNYWYYNFYYVLIERSDMARFFLLAILFATPYLFVAIYRFYKSRIGAWRQSTVKRTAGWLQRQGYSHDAANDLIDSSINLSMKLIGAITTAIFVTYYVHQLYGERWTPVILSLVFTYLIYKSCRVVLSLYADQPLGVWLARGIRGVWRCFNSSYTEAALILPLMIALPHSADKIILLGGLVQSLGLFATHIDKKNH